MVASEIEFQSGDNLSLHFVAESDLTEDERWFVTLGSILSCLIGDNINTIETGRDNGNVRTELLKRWFIQDTATFETALLRLAMGDKRNLFMARFNMIKRFYGAISNSNPVCRFMSRLSFKFACDWYRTKTKEDLKKTIEELEFNRINYSSKKNNSFNQMLIDAKTWIPLLKDKLGDYRNVNSLLSWDVVTMVNLSRSAVQVGIIERAEFVKFLNPIKKQIQKSYNNWNEVLLGYVIGGFLWKYSDKRAKAMVNAWAKCLADPRFPFHSVPFK